MDYTAKSLWIVAADQAEIRTTTLAAPGADHVLIQTCHSGISRGTEGLVMRAEIPASQYQLMRAPFQEGEFPFPVKYGYCNVGRVIKGPVALRDRYVFCLYPHQSLYTVPATAVTPLPEGLPPARAVLTANMETAVNGVWDLGPLPGDRIAVVGAGVVGLLVAWLCAQVPGCQVQVVDTDSRKQAPAAALGLDCQQPAAVSDDFDKLVHASGHPAGLQWALEHAAFEARLVELSWYGKRSVPLALGEYFHSRRLTLSSSQVGAVSPAQARRWDHGRRLQLALSLLHDPRLEILIDGTSPFDELPATLHRLAYHNDPVLCHRVDYPPA